MAPSIAECTAREVLGTNKVIPGRHLGSGGFCDVFEVIAHYEESKGESRYALKTIQPLLSARRLKVATHDLKLEGSLLSYADHPNIITIHGYTSTEGRDNFLILELLEETLDDRIESWRREMWRLSNPVNSWFRRKQSEQRKHELLIERLQVALQIASALEYLHEERIIFRDLKPDNIGFNANNVCKLFDFGLACRLPEGEIKDTYRMSSRVGTPRYMAPEVWKRRPYNEKVDVFSFALVFWEILALKKPSGYSVTRRGPKPAIDKSWPEGIQELLRTAWSPLVAKRPTMKEVCEILNDEIAKLQHTSMIWNHQGHSSRAVVPILNLVSG